MTTAENPEQMLVVELDTLGPVLAYLRSRPYEEVALLIAALGCAKTLDEYLPQES